MAKKKPRRQESLDTTLLIYQVKITLQNIHPPIWRRVLTNDCTLDKLHNIIQISMGWENCHLYAFVLEGVLYSDSEMGGDMDYCDSRSRNLSQLVSQGLRGFTYQYDFGDDWEHAVKIEKTLPAEPKVRYPRCIDGKRACPPEDCGGSYGYEGFLEAIRHPHHDEHEEMLEWVGGKFDPEAFDIKRVDRELQRLG